jgi:hypothetical protein
LRKEKEESEGGSDEVGKENEANGRDREGKVEDRAEKEKEKVESDVEDDGKEAEKGKSESIALVTEKGEGESGDGVEGNDEDHEANVKRSRGKAQKSGDIVSEEKSDGSKEDGKESDEGEGGGINTHGVLFLGLIDEAKEGSFHAAGEKDEKDGGPSVDIGVGAEVGGGREDADVERDKEPVEKATDDGRKAVKGCFRGEAFEGREWRHESSEVKS